MSELTNRESLFIGQRELQFFQNIATEIIEDVSMQKIRYYFIEGDLSPTTNDLYGESTQKIFRDPIEIYCLVLFNEPIVESGSFSTETKYSLKVYIQKMRVRDDLKVSPRMGDFVEFGNRYYEISKVTTPELIGGLDAAGFEMGTYVDCISTRSDVFNPNRKEPYDDSIISDSISI